MAGGVMHVNWYGTILRGDLLADEVAGMAPLALRYGATRFSVQRNRDDMYKITQMTWFEQKSDWYRFWDGPEMIEFRARLSGKYQIPIAYVWQDELAAGELGPEVPLEAASTAPEPEPEPIAAA
jgi:hypothetical protein